MTRMALWTIIVVLLAVWLLGLVSLEESSTFY
jgi:hypothetical protein